MVLLAIAAGTRGGGRRRCDRDRRRRALCLGFVGFFGLGGTRLLRRQPQLLQRPRFSESPLLPAVLLALGLAAFAAEIGLAAIIGAFLAGMMVAETKEQHPIEHEVAPLYAFFPPFFFVFIGLQVDLGAFADAGTLALLAGVTVLAARRSSQVPGSAPARSGRATQPSSASGWCREARSGSSSPGSAGRPE